MSLVSVDSKGYGKIYKAVMRSAGIPLLAKAIYAYLSCYAGSGIQAFPRRDRITRELGISKNTFTKHIATLEDMGYIARERTANGNLYTVLQSVPGIDVNGKADEAMTDMLVFEDVRSKGFGTVPKLMMQDADLSAQAKAIYAYFAAFAGAGTTAFPRRNTVMRELGLSDMKRYYTYMQQLSDRGYLTVEQGRNNGRYAINIYRLALEVQEPQITPGRYTPPKKKRPADSAPNTPEGDPGAAMSQKPERGGKPVPLSQKAMSQKPKSQKAAHGKVGHTSIKNRSKTNSFFEKEQVGPNHRCDGITAPCLDLENAKVLMDYPYWQREIAGWGELKERLHHFDNAAHRRRYNRKMSEALEQVALQIKDQVRFAADTGDLAAIVCSDAFADMLYELMDRWEEIRSMPRYVRAAVDNLISGIPRAT